MHHVASLQSKLHTQGAYVFSCTLPPALLAEWPGTFTCYCVNTGGGAATDNAWIWCSCMRLHMRTSVYSLTGRTLTLVKSLHRSQLWRNLRASTKTASPARNGNPSIWWLCSLLPILAFKSSFPHLHFSIKTIYSPLPLPRTGSWAQRVPENIIRELHQRPQFELTTYRQKAWYW